MDWKHSGHPGIVAATFICGIFAGMGADAAAESSAAARQSTAHAGQAIDQLDEVVVTATQAKLRELRKAAEQAEDAFYERYDEINKDDDFDVDCTVGKSGRFRQHQCKAVYVERAEAADGARVVDAWKQCDGAASPLTIILDHACGYQPMADVVEEGRKKEFAESLLRAIKSDARLRELAEEKEKVDLQVRRTRAKMFGKDAP
jgi:hypothetical protein